MDSAAAIARAVLYEGYVVWPYRHSAGRVSRHGISGCVFPREWSGASRANDPATRCATVLVKARPDSAVDVRIRFLQLMQRQAAAMTPTGLEDIDELTVAGECYTSWDEAIEREVSLPAATLSGLGTGHAVTIHIAAGRDMEPLMADDGRIVGFIRRTWREIDGTLEVVAARMQPGLYRLAARVTNATSFSGTDRNAVMHHAMASMHVVLHVDGGSFVSLQHPPESLRAVANDCRPDGLWSVLVGDTGASDTMLATPIILSDYPRIASDDASDLFNDLDGVQLLDLNAVPLADAAPGSIRASGPGKRGRKARRRTYDITDESSGGDLLDSTA
jgi:hypothetical protein